MFESFLMGGFECSTHLNPFRRRVDVTDWTKHDRFAEIDYRRLLDFGIKTARDGIRWHLIEKSPFEYDFSSAVEQVRAARKTGIQIVWDLFHYGFPNDLDIFSEDFIFRFAEFSKAFANFTIAEDDRIPFFCPVNEISFFAWAAGQVGWFHPYRTGAGDELKRQLARATMAAIDEIRKLSPNARFVQAEPAIEVSTVSKNPQIIRDAKNYRESQFQAFDLISGRIEPDLGGGEKYLDIIGVNFYPQNQWRHPSGRRILLGHKKFRPFNEILSEIYRRYDRPMIVSETGCEDEQRPAWFRYVFEQTMIAKTRGVPVGGICLYPVFNHPGWDDDRHCRNGLWDYPDERGTRKIYQPLAAEIIKLT